MFGFGREQSAHTAALEQVLADFVAVDIHAAAGANAGGEHFPVVDDLAVDRQLRAQVGTQQLLEIRIAVEDRDPGLQHHRRTVAQASRDLLSCVRFGQQRGERCHPGAARIKPICSNRRDALLERTERGLQAGAMRIEAGIGAHAAAVAGAEIARTAVRRDRGPPGHGRS